MILMVLVSIHVRRAGVKRAEENAKSSARLIIATNIALSFGKIFTYNC